MMEFIKLYGTAFLVFLAIDGVWLTVVAKDFYAKHLGFLMAPNPNLAAAGLFYLINIIGIVTLILMPALKEQSLSKALMLGAIYGLCAYATYDLTNMATIKNWPTIITIVDLIWGTILTTAVSGITFWIAQKYF